MLMRIETIPARRDPWAGGILRDQLWRFGLPSSQIDCPLLKAVTAELVRHASGNSSGS
jgi:hypothetical protein